MAGVGGAYGATLGWVKGQAASMWILLGAVLETQ